MTEESFEKYVNGALGALYRRKGVSLRLMFAGYDASSGSWVVTLRDDDFYYYCMRHKALKFWPNDKVEALATFKVRFRDERIESKSSAKYVISVVYPYLAPPIATLVQSGMKHDFKFPEETVLGVELCDSPKEYLEAQTYDLKMTVRIATAIWHAVRRWKKGEKVLLTNRLNQ